MKNIIETKKLIAKLREIQKSSKRMSSNWLTKPSEHKIE